jgi:glutamate synthase (ferredoxin)
MKKSAMNPQTKIDNPTPLEIKSTNPSSKEEFFLGQPWLVEERDACGVGFIAERDGRPSHKLLRQALKALGCMEHRGGCSADRDSGDGAGVMTGLPHKLLSSWFAENGLEMPESEAWGVGMVFLPQDETKTTECKQFIEETLAAENLTVLGWRTVPVNRADYRYFPRKFAGRQARSQIIYSAIASG